MLKNIVTSSLICLIGYSGIATAGFYVGPSLTYQSVSTSRSGYNIRYQGISPRFSLGFGNWLKEWFYLAGEVTGSPKSIVMNNEPKQGISLKIRYSYGINLLPAIALDDKLTAYARIGNLYTKFDQLDITRNGFLIGGGLETTVTSAWSLRAEYNYVKYSSINTIGSPRMDEFAVGAIYRF